VIIVGASFGEPLQGGRDVEVSGRDLTDPGLFVRAARRRHLDEQRELRNAFMFFRERAAQLAESYPL
jgi:hypothetical protein